MPDRAHHRPSHASIGGAGLRVIAWELTRRCPLSCLHCRGSASDHDHADELDTAECHRVIDSIARFAKPMLILTGGEPMTRPDLYDIAAHAAEAGLRPVLAPCGALINSQNAKQIRDAGITAISMSLDGPTAREHDAFRGVPGAFEYAMNGLWHIKDVGIPFQINTTVTRRNVAQLPEMLDLATGLGARTLDLFFLVPTGRGAQLVDEEIDSRQYEEALSWAVRATLTASIALRTTCAPHVVRVAEQAGITPPGGRPMGGCLAGRGFVFISHRGVLQPCGFLAVPCGDLRGVDYNFQTLYENSPVFRALRDPDHYGGKCGVCEFRWDCGGCRARAFEQTEDYLAAEPHCSYIPPGFSPESHPVGGDLS